jgi:hypothetical protein
MDDRGHEEKGTKTMQHVFNDHDDRQDAMTYFVMEPLSVWVISRLR